MINTYMQIAKNINIKINIKLNKIFLISKLTKKKIMKLAAVNN